MKRFITNKIKVSTYNSCEKKNQISISAANYTIHLRNDSFPKLACTCKHIFPPHPIDIINSISIKRNNNAFESYHIHCSYLLLPGFNHGGTVRFNSAQQDSSPNPSPG